MKKIDPEKLHVFTRLLRDMGRINGIISEAEEWAEKQIMPLDRITLGALKDIRKVARRWKKMTPAPEKDISGIELPELKDFPLYGEDTKNMEEV